MNPPNIPAAELLDLYRMMCRIRAFEDAAEEASRGGVAGWHFDLQHGQIQALDGASGRFRAVAPGELPSPACGCCEGLMELVGR